MREVKTVNRGFNTFVTPSVNNDACLIKTASSKLPLKVPNGAVIFIGIKVLLTFNNVAIN